MEGAAEARARIFGSNAAVEGRTAEARKTAQPQRQWGGSNAVCQLIGLIRRSLQKPTRRGSPASVRNPVCRA
jgi:hypothetical protein